MPARAPYDPAGRMSGTTNALGNKTLSAFDLAGNISSSDPRAGLDHASKKEIQKIMKKRKVDFDEARRLYMQERFRKNDIGPDGTPRDPKFVSFS